MTDIFVSYKREERDQAQKLAEVLSQIGYDVWWDAALLAGSEFASEIEEVIKQAKAVVVLWSRAAINSEWVKAEAEAARRKGIALSVRIDDVSPDDLPMLFRTANAVDLSAWKGSKTDPAFKQLLGAITKKAGSPRASRTKEEANRQLTAHAEEAEFWQTISQTPLQSASEYRSYLERFGDTAKWAQLANTRISKLDADEVAKKPSRIKTLGQRTYVFLGGGAALVGILAFFGITNSDSLMSWLKKSPIAGQFSNMLGSLEQADTPEAEECRKWAAPLGTNTAFLTLLKSQKEAQQPALAVEKCTAALALAPDNPALLALRARANYDSGDYPRAFSDAEAAARQGDTDGMVMLGTINYFNKVNDATPKAAFEHYRKAADLGNAVGQFNVASMLDKGKGTEKDPVKAFVYYQQAAEQGHIPSLVNLGNKYETNSGVPAADQKTNYRKAFALYEKAANQGHHVAQSNLGLMFENGRGTDITDQAERDRLAAKYYEMSAIQGYSYAQNYLGSLYLYGRAGLSLTKEQQNAKAFELYSKAAEQGNADAQTSLGYMYGTGLVAGETDAATNDRKAVELYGKAAAQGNAVAQYNLAYMYLEGRGVDRSDQTGNNAKAVSLYQKSADQNYAGAQYWLGRLYLTGRGVVPDRAKAKAYFSKAADQGYQAAVEELKALN